MPDYDNPFHSEQDFAGQYPSSSRQAFRRIADAEGYDLDAEEARSIRERSLARLKSGGEKDAKK